MPVVGTAGHVDHGKSTLVQALTGRDPDRWTEEKERGLTIDLGFAWTTLPSGTEISFVDVPGHERFIKNMLAGTDGFDVALFVVAADEGWMPQTEEHLAVLDLLGIEHAVVAITKADRVDEDFVELVTLDTVERLEGTRLADAPIVAVSAVTGAGMDGLRHALDTAVSAAIPTDRDRPRLWIDRAFTISGAGTVVTGTLTGGALAVGDQITIHPLGIDGRIRSLQSHEQDHDRVAPGARVAVNIVGLERGDVGRGAMLGRADQWRSSNQALVAFRRARYVDEPLANKGAYHLHLGSGAWPVRLRSVGTTPEGGELAVLTADEPMPVTHGDRFILREVGRKSIVAGGRIVLPDAPSRTMDAAAAAEVILAAGEDRDAVADAIVTIRKVADVAAVAAHSRGGSPRVATVVGASAVSRPVAASLMSRATNLVTEFHRTNPLRPGMPIASLASTLEVENDTLQALLADTDALRVDGAVVAAASHATGLTNDQEARFKEVAGDLRASGLSVPRIKDLGIDDELVHALLREERLVRISDDFAYLPDQIAEIQSKLADLPEEFTVSEFREVYGVSRKYAVPLLEWLDRRSHTIRRGDVRVVRG